MTRVDFNVEEIVALEIEADAVIKGRDFLSPYVWEEAGRFHMLVRSAPKRLTDTGNTGTIHYGESDDGVRFRVHAKPMLAPGAGGLDVGGCEDPTVVKWGGE